MSEAAKPVAHQTRDEQREKLFRQRNASSGSTDYRALLGPIVFTGALLHPWRLSRAAALAAVFSVVIVYWLTEPIPIL